MVRPKKPATDVKTYLVGARVTGEQRDQIHAAAARENLDLSSWLRKVILDAAARVSDRAAKKAAKRGA